jgi:hypothetical protein
MEQDRNSYMCSPTTMSTFDESSTQLASGDDVSINFVESGGACPKIFADIIDDSPLQNQIQRNKECKNKLKQRSRFLNES